MFDHDKPQFTTWLLRSKPVTVRTASVATSTNVMRPSGWRCAANAVAMPGNTPTDDGGEPSDFVITTPVCTVTTCIARTAVGASPPSSATYAFEPSAA